MKSLVLASTAYVILTSLAFGQGVDTKADITKAADEWKADYNKGDAAAIANMYADTALYSSQAFTATGKNAIEDGMKKDMAGGAKLTSITVDQSNRDGALNYADGAWTAEVKGPDGKPITIGGHWLSVSQYKDGKYAFLLHNVNMQMPPPPAK